MSHGYVPEAMLLPEERVERRRGPRSPQTLDDTGLSAEFVTDLLLKTLYVQGARTGLQLSEAVHLPFGLLDDLLLTLQHRRLVEVRATRGPTRPGYVFDLVSEGRERARDALQACQYVGPAPVPLPQYRHWVGVHSIRHAQVNREQVRAGFDWLVLSEDTLNQIGPAINSARSLFLYGHSGNGKTASAETIARLLGGHIFVPHAIEVDGQIIVVYDPVHHRPVRRPPPAGAPAGAEAEILATEPPWDRRYVEVLRPVVLTGGELTLEQLDLQYDPFTKLYQAPFQMKANGGVLIVDDFGRQRVPPRDLLNRWIVPLEKRVDFLTLHTGGKFPVPFDCLLIFATNLDPQELVEEAFLRRIHYKIRIDSPTREQYVRIFARCCADHALAYDEAAVRQIYRDYYEGRSIAPRGCHPRDLLDHLVDIAKYHETTPTLSSELVDLACRSYFLDLPTAR